MEGAQIQMARRVEGDSERTSPDVLVFGDTIRDPAMRHELPLAIADAFLYAERAGRRYAVVDQLEADRVRAAAPDVEIVDPYELGLDELSEKGLGLTEQRFQLAVNACQRLGVERATVPVAFPVGLADQLRSSGIQVEPSSELFASRRRRKSEAEIEGIGRALRAAEAGVAAAAALLRDADQRDGMLWVAGDQLTSELVKQAIREALQERDAEAWDMIAATGPQAADGHDMGSGPIRIGETVIVDLFPQDRESGCHADMTRTFVAGPVPDEVARWHELCCAAMARALAEIRPGADGRAIFQSVCDVFHDAGFPTELTKEPGEELRDGFYHGLAHGIGLEIHEPPYIGRFDAELVEGDVIAVEPGLYRHGYGGCRLEDLVLVTADGPEVLTRFPHDLTP